MTINAAIRQAMPDQGHDYAHDPDCQAMILTLAMVMTLTMTMAIIMVVII